MLRIELFLDVSEDTQEQVRDEIDSGAFDVQAALTLALDCVPNNITLTSVKED